MNSTFGVINIMSNQQNVLLSSRVAYFLSQLPHTRLISISLIIFYAESGSLGCGEMELDCAVFSFSWALAWAQSAPLPRDSKCFSYWHPICADFKNRRNLFCLLHSLRNTDFIEFLALVCMFWIGAIDELIGRKRFFLLASLAIADWR